MATPARPEISVRVVPGHLKNAPSRKGKRLTRAQLAAKSVRLHGEAGKDYKDTKGIRGL